MDEEGIRELSRTFLRICLLAIHDVNESDELRCKVCRKIEHMTDDAIKDFEERTGLTLYDGEIHDEEQP